MPTVDIVQLVVFALTWTSVAIRVISHIRGNRAAAALWLTGSLAGVAFALTIGWPPLMSAVAASSGGGLVALRVAQHCAVLVAGIAATAFTAHATSPDTARRVVRRRLSLLVVGLAALVIAGIVAGTGAPATIDRLHLLTPEYASVVGVAPYLLVFTLVLGVCMVNVAYLCMRYRRDVSGRAVRLGLLLLSLGSVLGAVYCGQRVVGTAVAAFGHDIGGALVAFALTIVAVLLLVVGATILGVARVRARA